MPAKKSKAPKTGKKGGKKGSKKGSKNTKFSTYIFRLLKQIHKGQVGISSKGMAVLESFVGEMFSRLATDAGQLSKGKTLSAKIAAAATRLSIPGELGRNAAVEAAKAVAKYAQ